jgi:hypothetical protein
MVSLPSGQRQQTVNLSGFLFGGSNPPLTTILEKIIDWASVAQLVECQPSKLDVASSNLVARSNLYFLDNSKGMLT